MKDAIIKALLVAWIAYVIVGYLSHRAYYMLSIVGQEYTSSILSIGLLVAITIGSLKYFKIDLKAYMAYIVLLVFMTIVYKNYTSQSSFFDSLGGFKEVIFLGKHIILHGMLLLVFSLCYCLGSWVGLFKKEVFSSYEAILLNIILGIAIVTAFMFLLASLGFLTRIPMVVLAGVVLLLRFKSLLALWKSIFTKTIYRHGNSTWTVVGVMLLLVTLSIYAVGAFKLFPVGFDSVALYQNLSNLIYDNGSLIAGNHAYNWPLFTSIGPLLFGSMKVSIFISHATLILVLLALYLLGSKVLNRKYNLFFILIVAMLPGIGFLGFVDAKVDLGYTLVILGTMLFFIREYEYDKDILSRADKKTLSLFFFLGIFCGFAMGIKYLAVIFVSGLIGMLAYIKSGIKLSLASCLLFIAVFFFFNVHEFGYLDISGREKYIIILVALVLSIYPLWKSITTIGTQQLLVFSKLIAVFAFGLFISFAPWVAKNTLESKTISAKGLLLGEKAHMKSTNWYEWFESIDVDYIIVESVKQKMIEHLSADSPYQYISDKKLSSDWKKISTPAKLQEVNKSNTREKFERKEIEIQRYLGYEKGIMRYLSIPFDFTFGVNIPNKRGTDYGFLYLLILPLILLLSKHIRKSFKIGIALIIMLILIFSQQSALDSVQLSNANDYINQFVLLSKSSVSSGSNGLFNFFISTSLAITESLSFLMGLMEKVRFPVSLFLNFLLIGVIVMDARGVWISMKSSVRLIVICVLTYLFFWMTVGNTIPYYGLPGLLLLFLVLLYWIQNLEKFIRPSLVSFVRKSLWVSMAIGVFLSTFQLFTNQNNNFKDGSNLFYLPFQYQVGTTDPPIKTYDKLLPELTGALTEINNNPDKYVYRIGSFLNYHIKNNDARVLQDDQLSIYNKITSYIQNNDEFLKILKASNYEYIILDLRIAGIDRAGETNLSSRLKSLAGNLNDKTVDLLYTDRIVDYTDPKTGEVTRKKGVNGKVVKSGTLVIFKIK